MHAALTRVPVSALPDGHRGPGDPAGAFQDKEKDDTNPGLVVPPMNEPDMGPGEEGRRARGLRRPYPGRRLHLRAADVDGKRIGGVAVRASSS